MRRYIYIYFPYYTFFMIFLSHLIMGNLPQKVVHQTKTFQPSKQSQSSKQQSCPSEVQETIEEEPVFKILNDRLSKNTIIASKNLLSGSKSGLNNQDSLRTAKQTIQNYSQQQMQESKQIISKVLFQEFKCFQGGSQKMDSQNSEETLPIDLSRYMKINQGKVSQNYQILQKIGQGSYGSVYRAIEKKSSSPRAIKKLYKGKMRKKNYESLLNQLQILKKMDHPNIIKLYDIYQEKRYLYVVTELCLGGSLFNIFLNFELSEDELKHIMTQILSAVVYMHNHNILHRDIKLENIVLVQTPTKTNIQDLQIKLIDFGVSVDLNKMKDQQLVGTLMYMPPESLDGVVSLAWDVWSCGILFFKLATRKPPYSYEEGNNEMLKLKVKRGAIQLFYLCKKSPELKKLLSYMLLKSHKFRISAKKALKDDSFSKRQKAKGKISKDEGHKMLTSLRNYKTQVKNNLISVIQGYMVAKKISQSQRQHLGFLFQSIDRDHSGIIEMQEFKKFYQDNSQTYDEKEMLELIKVVDKNKSGKIDFNEFITVMCERRSLFQLNSLDEAFNYFDTDGSGCLCIDEVRDLLKGVENQQLQRMFRNLDHNGDQRISKAQFLSYFEHMVQT